MNIEDIKKCTKPFWRLLTRNAPYFLYFLYKEKRVQKYLKNEKKGSFKKLPIDEAVWSQSIYDNYRNRWTTYRPEAPIYLLKYKGYYNIRRVLAFSLNDYFIYFANVLLLCDILSEFHVKNTYLMNIWVSTPYYDKIYKTEVSQSEVDSTEDEESYSNSHYYEKIRQIIGTYPHLKKISENCKSFFENYPDGVVISIDIANFFDNIPLNKLKEKLNKVADEKNPDSIKLIFRFLENYDAKFMPNKSVGIPQDILSVSGILAHFYFSDIDIKITEILDTLNGIYVRFVDELTFFMPNKANEGEFLASVSIELARNNLNVNTSKTVRLYDDEEIENYFLFSRFVRLNDKIELGDAIQNSPKNINEIALDIIDLCNNGHTADRAISLLKRFITIIKNYKQCAEALTEENLSKIFIFFEREAFLLSLDYFYLEALYFLKNPSEQEIYINLLEDLVKKYGDIYQSFKYTVEYLKYEISRK